MDLVLQREVLTTDWTMGALLVDGQHSAWSLEDPVREVLGADNSYHWTAGLKVPGRTAIPAGRYEVVVSFSGRFGKLLPLLVGVPDFEGVRLHGGNTAADTDGCPLLGRARDVSTGRIWDCATVVEALVILIQERSRKSKVYIDVRNP